MNRTPGLPGYALRQAAGRLARCAERAAIVLTSERRRFRGRLRRARRRREPFLQRPPFSGRQAPGHPHQFVEWAFRRHLWTLPEEPVSSPPLAVLISFAGQAGRLERCIGSLRRQTGLGHHELHILDSGAQDEETAWSLKDLLQNPEVNLVRAPGIAPGSRLRNLGASHTLARVLVFLDSEVRFSAPDGIVDPQSSPGQASRRGPSLDGLARLAIAAADPRVGAVGARLLSPDGRLLHAGIGLGLGGPAGWLLRGLAPSTVPAAIDQLDREVAAVSAACLAVSEEAFREVGGFDEDEFPGDLADVDLCLRLRSRGRHNLYLGSVSAVLAAPGPARARWRLPAAARLEARHGRLRGADPFLHPLLSLAGEDLAARIAPW